MKTLALVVMALTLVGCGTKSESEAVADVRAAFGSDANSADDSEIRELMRNACTVMETHSVAEVMRDIEMPPAIVLPVLTNATEVYCPEYSDAVKDYIMEREG